MKISENRPIFKFILKVWKHLKNFNAGKGHADCSTLKRPASLDFSKDKNFLKISSQDKPML
jgi:hypothetical protein